MISQGDKYKNKRTGKVATVLTTEPSYEYLIFVEIEGTKRFIHIEKLRKFWYDLKEGLQTKLF